MPNQEKARKIFQNSLGVILAFVIVGIIRYDDLSRMWDGISSSIEQSKLERQEEQKQAQLQQEVEQTYQTALNALNEKNDETARSHLERVLALDPEHEAAKLALARLLFKNTEFAVAYQTLYNCESLQCNELRQKLQNSTVTTTEQSGFRFENLDIVSHVMREQLSNEKFRAVGSCVPVAIMNRLASNQWHFAAPEDQQQFAQWIESQKPEDDKGDTARQVADTTPSVGGEMGTELSAAMSSYRGIMADYQLQRAYDSGLLAGEKTARSFAQSEFDDRDCQDILLSEFSATSSNTLSSFGGAGNVYQELNRQEAESQLRTYAAKIFRYQLYHYVHEKCLVQKNCG